MHFMLAVYVVDNMDLLLQKIMEQAQNIANAERSACVLYTASLVCVM